MKETQESRARSNSVTANRGARFGSEQVVGQTGSTENNYNGAFFLQFNVKILPDACNNINYSCCVNMCFSLQSLVRLPTSERWVQQLHQDPHHHLIRIVRQERL